jgi:hypothetical protein
MFTVKLHPYQVQIIRELLTDEQKDLVLDMKESSAPEHPNFERGVYAKKIEQLNHFFGCLLGANRN